ncbi:uncharacterized protein PHACADRAFT_264249 [Phanerochaete carnosa HHB-10118-sp]|uniref:Uncharacterized protein n=1 Tax=Phanerochaete carnosa (strain HHB-10118-sp) TaxID=650164 RepID=K5VVE2_PHACS|nr:uncharacterized protein PHACADRAFT_264249 [Phanerochaete carnosa HHB-10118-sp]EKM50770.1 hypothetical protein PHACADRAFT_264249 [Phanerochaete carnosa HHB-10118-sp]
MLGEFGYSTHFHKEETLVDLSDRIHKVLDQVADNVYSVDLPRSSSLRQFTPSDVAVYLRDYVSCHFPLDFPRCPDGASRLCNESCIPSSCHQPSAMRFGSRQGWGTSRVVPHCTHLFDHRYTCQEDTTIDAFGSVFFAHITG